MASAMEGFLFGSMLGDAQKANNSARSWAKAYRELEGNYNTLVQRYKDDIKKANGVINEVKLDRDRVKSSSIEAALCLLHRIRQQYSTFVNAVHSGNENREVRLLAYERLIEADEKLEPGLMSENNFQRLKATVTGKRVYPGIVKKYGEIQPIQ